MMFFWTSLVPPEIVRITLSPSVRSKAPPAGRTTRQRGYPAAVRRPDHQGYQVIELAPEERDRARDREALVVERLGHVVPAAVLLADQIGARHAHIVVEDLVRADAAQAP